MTTTPTKTASGARADTGIDVVTGAFSYSGRAIAQRLLGDGRSVRTLTGHPQYADPAQTTCTAVRYAALISSRDAELGTPSTA